MYDGGDKERRREEEVEERWISAKKQKSYTEI